MPAIDPNAANRTRKDVRTSNKRKAQTVRKARAEAANPKSRNVQVPAPAPREDRPSGAATETGRNERTHVARQIRAVKKKGGSLRKKTKAVHELARLGVLPERFLTGLEGRARDDAAAAHQEALKEAREEQEVADRIHAVEVGARGRGHGETLGPPVPLAVRLEKYQARTTDPRLTQLERDDAKVAVKALANPKTGNKAAKVGTPRAAVALGSVPSGLAKSAAALAEGTYRDPIGVPTKTAKQGALAVAALPASVAALITSPVETVKKGAKDYAERNAESYDEKLARVREEGGFAEAADVLTALSFGGGAAAKTALITKAPARAAKVVSGGARKAPKKGGPVRYFTGRAVDARKAAKYERKATRGRPLTALENEALTANRKAGRVVAVVPRKSGRKIAGVVAKARGKSVQGLKYDSTKGPFAQLARERFNLNKHEAEALWLGTEVGIRDADTARRVGTALRNKMVAGRDGYEPKGWEREMDVVAQIDKILEDPEKYFTPKFAETMDRIHEHAQEISDNEPQFKQGTKENRRRAVQAYLFNLEQGVVSAPLRGAEIIAEHAKPRVRKDPATGEWVNVPIADPVKAALRATHPDHGGNAEDFRAVRAATGDPNVPPLKYDQETDAEFNARIDAAAKKAGLAAPTYFRSEKQQGLSTDFGAYTVGGGGPKSTGKQFAGKNLGQGIFDTTYDQFIRGYSHNIKATHNYPLIARLDDDNRLRAFSPDDSPQGKELGALMNDVNRAEPLVEKGSVVFVNKGLFQKALEDAPDQGKHDGLEDSMDADASNALQGAVVREGDAVDPEFLKTNGWVAWPKEALRELESELHAGSAGGRAFDIAKSTTSKAILLTANVPWLALQVASETAVTGIATKGRALTPTNMIGTARWWKAMNHRQRLHVATELGLGATGSDTASIKLGATTNNALVNAWRDLKADDFWHRPRVGKTPIAAIISPVKWMRAADQGKTNVTRLLAGHSELTKKISPEGGESLSGALSNMAMFGKHADRLLPIMKKPSAEQLKYLQENPTVLEDMGDAVSNALGDWTTMTARERTWANRFVMFFPFVRYSTRLLFHTLPVDHPAVTGLLAELGHLTAEEYREVFGDDDLPWNLGKVYFGRTGESEYIDLSRANPAGNAIISGLARVGTNSSNVPGAAVGVLPPYAQWLIDQATGVSTFKGRPLRFNGETNPFWNKPWEIGLEDRGQLALAQVQSLFYPAREAMGRMHPESQSDESSLLFPTPMQYKGSDEIKGNSEDEQIRRLVAQGAEATQAFNAENNGGLLDLAFGPLAPRASRDKEASEERRKIAALKTAQAKTAAERKAYRDSHGGTNKPKPKAFGAGKRRNFNKGGG